MYGYAIAFFPFLPSRVIARPVRHAIVTSKTERIRVSLVRIVQFFFDQSPLRRRQGRKKRISGHVGVDDREINAVRARDGVSIHLRTSGDEHFGISRDQDQRLVEIVTGLHAVSPPGTIVRQYHVAAPRKWLADALERL